MASEIAIFKGGYVDIGNNKPSPWLRWVMDGNGMIW
jgi:hypothetical protein